MSVTAKVKASLAVQSVTKGMEHLSVELAGKLEVVGEGHREVLILLETYWQAPLGHPEKISLYRTNKCFVPITVAYHKISFMILCVLFIESSSLSFFLRLLFKIKAFIAIQDVFITNF